MARPGIDEPMRWSEWSFVQPRPSERVPSLSKDFNIDLVSGILKSTIGTESRPVWVLVVD